MDNEKNVVEKNQQVEIINEPITTEAKENRQDVEVRTILPDVAQVEEIEIVDIKMEEAFPFTTSGVLNEMLDDRYILIDGGTVGLDHDDTVRLQDVIDAAAESGVKSHPLLNGREFTNQHPIESISGLREELNEIEAVQIIYSSENGLGEFRKWHDDNPAGEDRTGYFVTMDAEEMVKICDSTHDVYGISVKSSGFVGNQSEFDHSDDYAYALVGILGAMRVRTDGTARAGDYVVPNAYGEATLSENKYGYKVISIGSYPSYDYVTIAITPQSDALSRIESSLSGSQADIGNILIELNIAKDKADAAFNNSQIAIDTTLSNQEMMDIIKENVDNANQHATNALDVANAAQKAADQAKSSATQATSTAQQAYTNAQNIAKGAVDTANQALSDVMDLTKDLDSLLKWGSGDLTGVTGFVQQAEDDHATIGSLVKGFGPDGTDVVAIIQKLDKNGATIQHLVSHIDKHSVGEYSPSYGLTHAEAISILQDTYIYVPTVDHIETMVNEPDVDTEFERGYSYTWNSLYGIWEQNALPVSTSVVYQNGTDRELWFCWQDVEQLGVEGKVENTYLAGTLYLWDGSQWVGVATVNDNYKSRVITSVKQTADTIEMSVIDSGAEGSTFRQKLDNIFTTVFDSDGYISSLEQTATAIRAGVYTPDDRASQFELLASENDTALRTVITGRFHVVYQSLMGELPDAYEGKKYLMPPQWSEAAKMFVFDENKLSDTGSYYFTSEDFTKYCKVIDEDQYEIYTIGNQATSALESRISNTEAILNGSVEFATENSKALGGIYAKANDAETSINYLASYYYHSLLRASETEVTNAGNKKYSEPPTWDQVNNKYVFDENTASDTGIYYMADEDEKSYCKVVTLENGKRLYEVYGVSGSSAASMLQQADANSAAIGLVVNSNGIMGSAIIEAINGEGSTAKIAADKIVFSINASDPDNQFALILDDHQATLQNGDLKIIDDKYQILLNPTDAFRIQKNIGTTSTPNWTNQFYVETDTGDVYFAGKMVGGLIESTNFAMNGNVCLRGMQIDLNNGEMVSPYFSLGADGGRIAGWTINDYNIYSSGAGSKYVALNSSPNETYAFWAGNQSPASAPFSVTKDGTLTAVNAEISGAIHMGAGSSISWEDVDDGGLFANIDDAIMAAGNARDAVKALAMGQYEGGTFISGSTIYTPTLISPDITTNSLDVYQESGDDGGIALLNPNGAAVVKMGYVTGDTEHVFFTSEVTTRCIMQFAATVFSHTAAFNGDVEFHDTVDFTYATSVDFTGTSVDFTDAEVTGLKLNNVAVFG